MIKVLKQKTNQLDAQNKEFIHIHEYNCAQHTDYCSYTYKLGSIIRTYLKDFFFLLSEAYLSSLSRIPWKTKPS